MKSLVILSALVLFACGTDTTKKFHPELSGVAHDGERFVAVGAGGFLFFSTSGTSWVPWDTGTGRDVNAITAGAGTFVAVGNAGTFYTSLPNGRWRVGSFGNKDLYAVTYGGASTSTSLFVAVGENGWVITSPDGLSWALRARSSGPPWLGDVTYGVGRFVAIEQGGDAPGFITSPDGITWTSSGALQETGGCALTSGTGKSGIDASFYPVLLAVQPNATILTSLDADTWTVQVSGAWSDEQTCGAAAGDASMFAVVARSGEILTSSDPADGTTWVPLDYGEPKPVVAVTFADSQLVAVGGDGTVITADCADGVCSNPDVNQIEADKPKPPGGGGGGGDGGGGNCSNGWLGSSAIYLAVGTNDDCVANGDLSVCIDRDEFEAATGLPLPNACHPENATGCFNDTGALAHPCCAGLTCVIRVRCGAPAGAVGGACMQR